MRGGKWYQCGVKEKDNEGSGTSDAVYDHWTAEQGKKGGRVSRWGREKREFRNCLKPTGERGLKSGNCGLRKGEGAGRQGPVRKKGLITPWGFGILKPAGGLKNTLTTTPCESTRRETWRPAHGHLPGEERKKNTQHQSTGRGETSMLKRSISQQTGVKRNQEGKKGFPDQKRKYSMPGRRWRGGKRVQKTAGADRGRQAPHACLRQKGEWKKRSTE